MKTPDTERELRAIEDALAGRPVEDDLLELAALAVAVRDDRAEPDELFTNELDAKVARGFADPSGRRRLRTLLTLPRIPMPVLAFGATACLVIAVVGVALTGGTEDTITPTSGGGDGRVVVPESDSAAGTGAGEAPATAAKPQQDKQAASGATGAAGGGGSLLSKSAPATSAPVPSRDAAPAPAPAAPRGRKVERQASLTLAAPIDDVDSVGNEVVRVTDRFDGLVLDSNVSTSTTDGRATFTLRFPSARLQAALAELSRLADVRSRNQATNDITGAYVDARERLQDARTERKSLLRALANATTPNESSSIRRRLRIVSGQIASAKGAVARVNSRASNSTVAVTIEGDDNSAAGDNKDEGTWTPADAFDDAQRILEIAAGVVLIALAVALPFGLLLAAAWWAARVAVRRRREAVLDA